MSPVTGLTDTGVLTTPPRGTPGTGAKTGKGNGIPIGIGIGEGVNTGEGLSGSVGGVLGVYQYNWLLSR